MVDQLLSTQARVTDLAVALNGWLPAGITVYPRQLDPTARTPFVVLDVALRPERVGLAGAWSMATLVLRAHSVHATQPQADALADLVRTWVLTVMTTPGLLDVEAGDEPVPDDPGSVPQVYESWLLTLARTGP